MPSPTPGFSFIEVVSDCPEYFGRYNKAGGGAPRCSCLSPVRDAAVAGPLAAKRFVNHVPSSEPPPGMDTGVLQREVRPVFSGIRKGGDADES